MITLPNNALQRTWASRSWSSLRDPDAVCWNCNLCVLLRSVHIMRVFVAILLFSFLAFGCGPRPAVKSNQKTPSSSPSGKYVLTVPIERDPTDRNLPFWRVTISDTTGKLLYKDDSKFIGTLNVYWCWDSADRVWLYNSDDGMTYVWEIVDGHWRRWPLTVVGAGSPVPPAELYPDSAKRK